MILSRTTRLRNYGKNVSFCISIQPNQAFTKHIFFSENSLSLAPFNTFNYKMCSTNVFFIEILPLMVDYACFFGEMHKLSERNAFKDISFLARSCKIPTKNAIFARNTTLANFCRKWKSVARFLQEFCKM